MKSLIFLRNFSGTNFLDQATTSVVSYRLQCCWKCHKSVVRSDRSLCGNLVICSWSHWSMGGPRFVEKLALDRNSLFLWKASKMDWSCSDGDRGVFSPEDISSSPSSEDSSDSLSYGRVRPLDLQILVVKHSYNAAYRDSETMILAS